MEIVISTVEINFSAAEINIHCKEIASQAVEIGFSPAEINFSAKEIAALSKEIGFSGVEINISIKEIATYYKEIIISDQSLQIKLKVMNATQEAKLNMYRATQNHCEPKAALLATVPAFSTAFGNFKVIVSTLIATVQEEELVTKGITIDKGEARITLCRLSADIAGGVFAYASTQNNNTLKQQVNFSYTDLFKAKDDVLGPRCQNILDLATTHLADLAPYAITNDTLTSFLATLDAYQQKVPTPRNAAASKKTISEKIKNLIKQADTILKEQMDKTVYNFKETEPDFVRTYKNNRIIIDPSHTVTQLKGAITNSANNTPISGATINIVEAGVDAVSNAAGLYEINPAPLGTYTIRVTAPTYLPQEKTNFLIKQGKINTQDFLLDPQ